MNSKPASHTISSATPIEGTERTLYLLKNRQVG